MKNIFMRIVLILLLGIYINHAQAQQTTLVDQQLSSLIVKAMANHTAIKEMETQLQAYPIKDMIAKNSYQPSILTDFSYRYSNPVPQAQFGSNLVQFAPYNNYSAAVGINQLVYDFGKTKWQLEKLHAEKNVAIANIDVAKNAIAYQVANVYFTILYLHQAVLVQQQQINALQENEKIIVAKFNQGEALKYDILSTQVRTKNAINKLTDYQAQLDKQFILLEWLTGSSEKSTFRYFGDSNTIQLIASTESWQNKNPNALLLEKKLALLGMEKTYAKVQTRPSLSGNAYTGYRNGIQPNIENMQWASAFGLTFTVPIHSTYRPKQQQKLIQVSMDATKASMKTLEASIQKDLNMIVEDYRGLDQKAKNTNLLVAQAAEAYQLAKVRFNAGLITSAELLLAQNNVEDASLQSVQLEYLMTLDKLESNKLVGNHIW
jgi:hypothetical protein